MRLIYLFTVEHIISEGVGDRITNSNRYTHAFIPCHTPPSSADEITAFEAYLDLYILTGRKLFLDAVEGAWGMFRDHWIHVGGSQAINEGRRVGCTD